MKNQCFGCNERHVGCHSECDKYKEYRAHLDKNNNNMRITKIVEGEMIDYVADRQRTYKAKKHLKSKH